jgi:tRNA-splicing ligase RtcB
MVSPTHIYPGPVGVDVKCSMSLLQFDLPGIAINDKKLRRELISAITERIPVGAGSRQRIVKKARNYPIDFIMTAITEGVTERVCKTLGIPYEWARRCEDSFHPGHDGTSGSLQVRLEMIRYTIFQNFALKLSQLGSYGSGNHFGECEVVSIVDREKADRTVDAFGLTDGNVAFLSHCGSRGFGNIIAKNQFKILQAWFAKKGIPFPGDDRELVYAELGTPLANDYLDDMALAANFATINHMLINALIIEAFEQVIPGVQEQLVYFISHNIARKEHYKNREVWVHRKGATRAFPAGHPALQNTPFAKTGHPILLPGDPVSGSVIMVAEQGAQKSCFSVNHGAGRQIGRKAAIRELNQMAIDNQMKNADILTNCRLYPKDEAPAAYKDFNEVLRSVEIAGLARTVAFLKARFVIKDAIKEN